jgi:hypothetical protein
VFPKNALNPSRLRHLQHWLGLQFRNNWQTLQVLLWKARWKPPETPRWFKSLRPAHSRRNN